MYFFLHWWTLLGWCSLAYSTSFGQQSIQHDIRNLEFNVADIASLQSDHVITRYETRLLQSENQEDVQASETKEKKGTSQTLNENSEKKEKTEKEGTSQTPNENSEKKEKTEKGTDTSNIHNNEIKQKSDAPSTISGGFIILLFSILLSFFFSKIGQYYHINYIQPAIVSTFIGLIVGIVCKFILQLNYIIIEDILAFNENVFFIMLLPPIIFQGGLYITSEISIPFFKNLGAILWLAVVCTLISFFIIGFLSWSCGFIGISIPLTLREALAFGAILCSTDPVAVISVMNQFAPKSLLYVLVFGESLWNDAIAIVLYGTIKNNHSVKWWLASLYFFGTFFASIAIGCFVGFASALGHKRLKHLVYYDPLLETSLLIVFPWLAYLMAEMLKLSGILSICCCGTIMGSYTFCNLSEAAQHATQRIFGAFSLLAETVVFIFLGLSVTSFKPSGTVGTHISSLVIMWISRIVSVHITCLIINQFRVKRKIGLNIQRALIVCGFRGAIALALSERSRKDFPNAGNAFLSVTISIAVSNLLIIGPLLYKILCRLNVLEIEDYSEVESTVQDEINKNPIKNLFYKLHHQHLSNMFDNDMKVPDAHTYGRTLQYQNVFNSNSSSDDNPFSDPNYTRYTSNDTTADGTSIQNLYNELSQYKNEDDAENVNIQNINSVNEPK